EDKRQRQRGQSTSHDRQCTPRATTSSCAPRITKRGNNTRFFPSLPFMPFASFAVTLLRALHVIRRRSCRTPLTHFARAAISGLLAGAAVTARRYDTAFRRPPVHRGNRVLDARDAAAGTGAH